MQRSALLTAPEGTGMVTVATATMEGAAVALGATNPKMPTATRKVAPLAATRVLLTR
jgi:hypothetical protein